MSKMTDRAVYGAAPLRSFDDFIWEGARFQVPPFSDPVRVSNRVTKNLLYYQSNYFLVFVTLFALVAVFHPTDIFIGFLLVAGAAVAILHGTDTIEPLRRLRERVPLVLVAVGVCAAYIILNLFGSLITFLFGIALPVFVILVHAALRMRNLKNKVATQKETLGLSETPMGVILKSVGIETSSF